jgi:glycosyltransferase involved in cell wall biosynthesis
VKGIWITWERHRRTREIARWLQIPLLELSSSTDGRRRYVGLVLRTTSCLLKERPSHVFVQCPSVVLGLWVVFLKRVLRYVVIVDLHNEAVEPFVNPGRLYHRLLRRIHAGADLGLVSNLALASIVKANGGRTFVLPDRLPTFRPHCAATTRDGPPYSVVFVCSFAPDEPYRAVIEAATFLSDIAVIHVTGRGRSCDLPHSIPANIHLTGYLPDAEYDCLLGAADVVVDLTAMENCLVCGAYEAVALEKPLVTSDTGALRSYFNRGTVFTQHDPCSIATAIRTALNRRVELHREMHMLRGDLETHWNSRVPALVTEIRASGSI